MKKVYIWLDKNGSVRYKTRYLQEGSYPTWTFDGSSTGQATTHKSDISLIPVSVRKYKNTELILCEMGINGSPIESDYRVEAVNKLFDSQFSDWMFGFEQEFVLRDISSNRILGWPENGFPEPQGDTYCRSHIGSEIIDSHANMCLSFGLSYFGNNAEVMLGQWEFQIGPGGIEPKFHGIRYCDDLIFARYLLELEAYEYGCLVDYSPKPVEGNWNGSGLHTNFSNNIMRKGDLKSCIPYLRNTHAEYLKTACGEGWERRMTGELETSDPSKFTVGSSDRSCSIRIPVNGKYLEDRRPCANANPYKIVAGLVE